MNLYDKVFPPKVIVLPNGKNVTKPRSRAPLAAAVLLALTVLSVKVTGLTCLCWPGASRNSSSFWDR